MPAGEILRPGRLVGLDVARCLALLGMMATHLLDPRAADGDWSISHQIASGRASALFAVLAGISLALLSGRQHPIGARDWLPTAVGLAIRAVLIALVGLLLGALDTGLAIILTYYGALFLLGLPFLRLRAPALAALAAGWLVAGPVFTHLLGPHLPPRGYDNPRLGQLTEPGQLFSELLFTGYYPVVPWLAYLLAGMAIGRLDLTGVRRPALLAAGGAALAAAAIGASRYLTSRPGVLDVLLSESGSTDEESFRDVIAGGLYGTTPVDGSWQWLLVAAPHSATPFDLAQTIGSAMLVIGVCLVLIAVLPKTAQIAVAVLFGAGTMTLTLYSLHAVMRTEQVWPPERPESYGWHVLIVLAIGAFYVAARRRGPLEVIVGAAHRRLTRGRTRRVWNPQEPGTVPPS